MQFHFRDEPAHTASSSGTASHNALRYEEALTIARGLAARLAESAVERDRTGGHAAEQRQWLRDSGLLGLSIPREHGGWGADWPLIYAIVRTLAKADSALAHVFGFHHLQVAGVRVIGSPAQQDALYAATVEQNLFWGNALNTIDKRLDARETDDGYIFHGVKSFCSGSVGSDMLSVSGWHAPTNTPVIAAVPTRRKGIQIHADWDAFGQRQTDSGTVSFDNVRVASHEVLQRPGTRPTVQATLRTQVSQLMLSNLYLGIGLGAFDEARRYNRDEARPWHASGVQASVDDPYIQHRYGELWLLLRPAVALADEAARRLDAVWRKGADVTADERGELAVAVAEAKVLAHRAGIEVSNQLFELTGARSTSARYGLDRFWRNARVHTLHDPVDYKLRDLGRYVLQGTYPDAGSHS
jgi:alkylation response protein AidB-like acyl-CoA dehydrogenase